MVLGYEQITRDPVRRPAKRNLVASCHRVHGTAFLDRVRILFVETGTATNLLGILRTTAPDVFDAQRAGPINDDSPGPPRPVRKVPVSVTNTPVTSPPFDPASTRRYDLHPWSANEEGLFDSSELGGPQARSPSAQAVDR